MAAYRVVARRPRIAPRSDPQRHRARRLPAIRAVPTRKAAYRVVAHRPHFARRQDHQPHRARRLPTIRLEPTGIAAYRSLRDIRVSHSDTTASDTAPRDPRPSAPDDPRILWLGMSCVAVSTTRTNGAPTRAPAMRRPSRTWLTSRLASMKITPVPHAAPAARPAQRRAWNAGRGADLTGFHRRDAAGGARAEAGDG
jgi:hypothetical protein